MLQGPSAQPTRREAVRVGLTRPKCYLQVQLLKVIERDSRRSRPMAFGSAEARTKGARASAESSLLMVTLGDMVSYALDWVDVWEKSCEDFVRLGWVELSRVECRICVETSP